MESYLKVISVMSKITAAKLFQIFQLFPFDVDLNRKVCGALIETCLPLKKLLTLYRKIFH